MNVGGIIPAHAGKTCWFVRQLLSHRDHPRSRGENSLVGCKSQSFEGSSPLTRGKRASTCSVTRSWGIIPAHAGKTAVGGQWSYSLGDHPRSRGENPIPRRPGARGLGIIPAHAGKTIAVCALATRSWDHPRSRGENRVYDMARAVAEGSSPLTRGKRWG